MGLGAGFLTYAYGDKMSHKNRKKRSSTPGGYYDPAKPDKTGQAKMTKAISVGFFLGVMSFIYFSNR